MTFRASNVIPVQSYVRVRNLALEVQRYCTQKADIMSASGMDANNVLAVLAKLRQAKIDFDTLKTVPGLAEYAQSQEDDPTYDVAAEFTALLALIDTAIANIASAIPADAQDYLLIAKLVDNEPDYRTFTSAQLSGIESDLRAIAAAVS